ncbi:MAG: hypothetical protein ACOYKD_03320 [Anaerolineaceae bacterium]
MKDLQKKYGRRISKQGSDPATPRGAGLSGGAVPKYGGIPKHLKLAFNPGKIISEKTFKVVGLFACPEVGKCLESPVNAVHFGTQFKSAVKFWGCYEMPHDVDAHSRTG